MKRLSALILALALFLCACSSGATEDPTTSSLPEIGEEITESTSESDAVTEPESFGLSYIPQYGLNPYTCTATVNRGIFSLLYEPLFVTTQNFTPSPILCKSLSSSEDEATYRFWLLDNARFSDGSPLTPEDVKASLHAARESSMYAGRLQHIDDITILEDRSIEISLTTSYENFALLLDVPILKASTIEDSIPIGTGPYAYKDQALVRNNHWWNTEHGVLNCDRIFLSAAKDSNDLRNQFEFGNTDLVYCDPNSSAAAGYRCDYEVWESPTTILHYLGFNRNRGWFANNQLRTAMTYALDRDAYVHEIYSGFAQPTPLPCSPLAPFYDEQMAEDYDYSPKKFQEAVEQSGLLTSTKHQGYSGKILVSLDDSARVKLAYKVCDIMNEAGLPMTVSALDKKQYETALKNRDFDLFVGEVRLTANFDLSGFSYNEGSLLWGSEINRLLTLCKDARSNSGVYPELFQNLLDTAPICPVVFKSFAVFVTRGKITNNSPGVDYVFHDHSNARNLADAYRSREENSTP